MWGSERDWSPDSGPGWNLRPKPANEGPFRLGLQHGRIGSVLLLNVKTTISPSLDDHKLTAKNISKLYFVTNRGQEEAEVQRWRV